MLGWQLCSAWVSATLPGTGRQDGVHRYVLNNPLRYTDPTGHKCVGEPEECLDDDGNPINGSGDLGVVDQVVEEAITVLPIRRHAEGRRRRQHHQQRQYQPRRRSRLLHQYHPPRRPRRQVRLLLQRLHLEAQIPMTVLLIPLPAE
jgi:hypothetical protein